MAEMRTCHRTGCGWPAAASLSYRYETREAWLADLSAEPNPALWELCPHHADQLTVPLGWERLDRRTIAPAPVEPAGSELVGGHGRPAAEPMAGPGSPAVAARVGGEGHPVNRYAALSRKLPSVVAVASRQRAEPDRVATARGPGAQCSASSGRPRPNLGKDVAPEPDRELGQLAIPTLEDDDGRQAVVRPSRSPKTGDRNATLGCG